MTESTPYIGRFAPSPTGPLHFGSAVAAVASYLQARRCGGRWLVRIDDLDPPREAPGAADSILRSLEALALHWDGAVTYQSGNHAQYAQALARLAELNESFDCGCTRKDLVAGIYPGHCREGLRDGKRARSIRLRVSAESICFHDQIVGEYSQNLESEVGDFVLRRSDGLFAYHLATVVDDAAANITDIVRGIDLLDSTPRQIYLQSLLGLPHPSYAHIPVVLGADGAKLSKQACAPALDDRAASQTLHRALEFLRHPPAPALTGAPCQEILQQATREWDLRRLCS